jgi:hypothetical protein
MVRDVMYGVEVPDDGYRPLDDGGDLTLHDALPPESERI